MGGGSGSDAPGSAPLGVQAPEFLVGRLGEGKYNIGIVGPAGAGKSSLLNSILGGSIADTDFVECTLAPCPYALPLEDPRGHFHAFIDCLPDVHQRCAFKKLKTVTIWDLPGCGTRLHPCETYVRDKGVHFFDYVVVLIRDRVEETDCELVQGLAEHNIKHIVCRSKFDLVLNALFLQRKKEPSGRKLNPQELIACAQNEIERLRHVSVTEFREQAPKFHGHLYFVMASQCLDEDDIYYDTVNELIETQLAINHLFVDIIFDRHGHDLRRYFDHSLFGHASRAAYNFVWSRLMEARPTATGEGDVGEASSLAANISQPISGTRPRDLSSQIHGEQSHASNVAGPDASILSESESDVFSSSASWICIAASSDEDEPELPRCFMKDTLFPMESGGYMKASELKSGSRVLAACGKPLDVISVEEHVTKKVVELCTHAERRVPLLTTPNHRVMVPGVDDSRPRPVSASSLKKGDVVLCLEWSTLKVVAEELKHVNSWKDRLDVLAIAFRPDLPVGTLHLQPQAILTKGKARNVRRAGMNQRAVDSGNLDAASVPAVDSGNLDAASVPSTEGGITE
jgi:hypothetical protein